MFELKTEFMYNQRLKIIDGADIYEATVEFAPEKERMLLVWLDDFHIPSNKIASVKKELNGWLSEKEILVVFKSGNRIG
ncbi:MAG: hypothetical protein LIO86_12315 [Lachnospiraceae bacterium]|nr:hypothetical protein [Lachnospiraceae bacterium]